MPIHDRKNVSIRFTPERHLLVRTLAARERVSINDFVQGLIDNELIRRGADIREEAAKTLDAIDVVTASMKQPVGAGGPNPPNQD